VSRLNVGGSFVATTANALQFPDGNVFSASAPNNPAPTLTVNPSAFLYNQIANQQARRIEVQEGANLFVGFAGVQANLLLVGGDILINGGKLQGASGSQIQIGAFTGTGSVGLIVNNTRLSLNTPVTGVTTANVSLNNALINLGHKKPRCWQYFPSRQQYFCNGGHSAKYQYIWFRRCRTDIFVC
jgi:large exoprotein involved in heme utilization and adhesion